MLKRVLSIALVGLLLNMIGVNPVHAESKEEKEIRFIERVKDGISKLGTGAEARVEVSLRNKRKLKGYVSEAGEESFVVVDATSGAATTITYPQVKKVKGNNLSTDTVITIAMVGALMALALFVAWESGNEK